jgi:hypothetical protein
MMKGHIEDYISRERENPTSKKVLTAQTGLNERAARSHIAEARRRGVPIIGLLSGGYYVTENPEEWKAFVEQERRRAVATFKRLAILPAEATEQISLFNGGHSTPPPEHGQE